MGIFSGDDLVQSFRVRTDHKRSSDEYGVMMHSFLSCIGMEFSDFHGVMISSVVPGLNFTLMRMVQTYFHKTPAFVSSQLNCGIDISYSRCPPWGRTALQTLPPPTRPMAGR